MSFAIEFKIAYTDDTSPLFNKLLAAIRVSKGDKALPESGAISVISNRWANWKYSNHGNRLLALDSVLLRTQTPEGEDITKTSQTSLPPTLKRERVFSRFKPLLTQKRSQR